MKDLILSASILSGTIIGAGIFSLPWVFARSGTATGIFYLALFSIFYLLVYWLYTQVILNTSGEHRFVGYARIYLGKNGFAAALLIGLVQLVLVLTIYLILAPSFSKLFLSDGYLVHLLGFWFLGSAAILFNTRRIAFLEFLMMAGILAIIVLILILGLQEVSFFGAVTIGELDLKKIFVIGPILFSLSGTLAVPEVVSYFRETRRSLNQLGAAIILGGLVPALAYVGFVIGIINLSGVVSEDAVSGLIGRVPTVVLALLGVLGFLSLISSYIVVGLNTRRILEYDLRFSGWLSRTLVIVLPLVLYLAGLQSFIGLISFVGSIFLPLEIGFIILMWIKMRSKKWE